MDQCIRHLKREDAGLAAAWTRQRARLRIYLSAFRLDEAEAEALVERAVARAREVEADRPEAAFDQLQMLLEDVAAVSSATPATQRNGMRPEAVTRRPLGFFVRRVLQPRVAGLRPPQIQR